MIHSSQFLFFYANKNEGCDRATHKEEFFLLGRPIFVS